MMLLRLPLAAVDNVRTTFEWGRIQSNSDWILPIAVCVGLMLFVRLMYRRDARELHPVLGWLLTILRSAVVLGLLILYLQPQWRTETEETRNSRVMLLVDTSLSMGLTDVESSVAPGTANRAQQIARFLEQTPLLERLNQKHDVVVLRFADRLQRIASLEKGGGGDTVGADSGDASSLDSTNADKTEDPARAANADGPSAGDGRPVDWSEVLIPAGNETRLGQALRQLAYEERNAPTSGIIVFSDGGQNAGPTADAAVAAARETKIPVFTVGIGSDQRPVNVRVSDFVVPARAYPGDDYTVTGYVQAQGLAGRVATVQLLSREAGSGGEAKRGSGKLVRSAEVTLGADGEVVPVKFELEPEQTGRQTLSLRIEPPAADRNPADNVREADIEIVDRRNRVLLLASGPMREYRFLRSLLYRDKSTEVDVLLQTGQPGISQDADEILDDFPATREEMFDYDGVLALDPDWPAFADSQLELLETWVAEQGGGLIVSAGRVHAGRPINSWIQEERMRRVRALYPVQFNLRFSAFDATSRASKEPWPLDFTREGLDAEFLWLDDSQSASQQVWAGFPGVYSYFPVRGPKPGATTYATFSDPRAAERGEAPVYFAGQFYGSGRVFYMGSAEMWRLRQLDESYYERFYTSLIRHVCQGRLLRGSSRGVLLVGRERYLLGSDVEVRAQLTNAQLEPLDAPSVALQVVLPDRSVQTVTLMPDPSRAGTFAGHFTALEEGVYRLELPVPESESELLTRRVQVNVPARERQNPQRNDAVLARIANGTGGKYFVGLQPVGDETSVEALPAMLKDRTTTVIRTAKPNPLWELTWLRWMMLALCGALCLEWLIRRLTHLA